MQQICSFFLKQITLCMQAALLQVSKLNKIIFIILLRDLKW